MIHKPFPGGVLIPGFKDLARDKPTRGIPLSAVVHIPLLQHIGAPCVPIVVVGEQVALGQKIGEAVGAVSAPIHSSVCGVVTDIGPRTHCTGLPVPMISIAVREERGPEMSQKLRALENVSPLEIRTLVREAGIVGMGGAGFPTSVKLTPPENKPIDSVIVNGAECEPYLCADHRYMLEHADSVVMGLLTVMKAVGAVKGIIAVEDNKPDALAALTIASSGCLEIETISVKTTYPQGGEKQLIRATLRRVVPAGGLPSDVGVVVQNAGTCVAIARALLYNHPLTERVVTVAGPAVPRPGNYVVPVGTPIGHVLKACGVHSTEGHRVIMGGPMTGLEQTDLTVPTIKTTGGLLVIPIADTPDYSAYDVCVRCGLCVEGCPMLLYPHQLSTLLDKEQHAEAKTWDVMDCIECGICSYVCPSRRPTVQLIKRGKMAIRTQKL